MPQNKIPVPCTFSTGPSKAGTPVVGDGKNPFIMYSGKPVERHHSIAATGPTGTGF